MTTPADELAELRRQLLEAEGQINNLTQRVVDLVSERGRLLNERRLLETRVQVFELTDELRQLHLLD